MNAVERRQLCTESLSTPYSISRIIKGGWQLSGDHGAIDRQTAIADMMAFVDAGITTFDCADIYAGVENMIGEFIDDLRRQRGNQALDTIRIHTKFVPDYARLATLDRRYVNNITERSLQRLRLERLDLVQFHWWDYAIPGCIDAIMMLDDLRREGKIKHLGVTNFDAAHIESITAAGIDLVSAQVQYSLLDRRPGGAFARLCAEKNIHLLCYGVLAGGFISESWRGRADPGFQFENRSLVKYRLIIEEFGGWALFQTLLDTLHEIARKHSLGYDVSLSAVAIRYVLDQPQVGAAIIGARYARYLPQTLAVFDVKLSDGDIRSIGDVLAQAKGPGGDVYALERDRDGRHGRIMKYNLND